MSRKNKLIKQEDPIIVAINTWAENRNTETNQQLRKNIAIEFTKETANALLRLELEMNKQLKYNESLIHSVADECLSWQQKIISFSLSGFYEFISKEERERIERRRQLYSVLYERARLMLQSGYSAPKDNNNSSANRINQKAIILIHAFLSESKEGYPITPTNKDKIAKSFGYNKPNSGKSIHDDLSYGTPENRLKTNDKDSHYLQRKISYYEQAIDYLRENGHFNSLEKAIKEFTDLKNLQ